MAAIATLTWKNKMFASPSRRKVSASVRFNYNHFHMKTLAPNLLHPAIPITDHENLEIADLGAGTGLWACELAAALPSATFTLFDNTSWLFPPSHLRPQNTRWIEHDCFSAFPVDCLGRFDIVNVRFWKCRINDDTVDFFFQNLFTLLKPGGYLQWFEPQIGTAQVKGPPGLTDTPASHSLVQRYTKPGGLDNYTWMNDLASAFQRNSFCVIANDIHRQPPWLQSVSSQTVQLGLGEQVGLHPGIEELQEKLAEEAECGVYVDLDWAFVVGRKAKRELCVGGLDLVGDFDELMSQYFQACYWQEEAEGLMVS